MWLPRHPAHDHGTVTVWRLLREFNDAVQVPSADAEQSLARLLERRPVQGEARERFLHSVLPYFCSIGAYDRLRPWLDASRLRSLAQSTNAWELSLALPELVACADHWAARHLLSRLAQARGWVNTECVSEAARGLARRWRLDPAAHAEPATLPIADEEPGDDAAPASSGLCELIDALLKFLDAEAASYWGRLHDHHLVDTLVTLLALEPELPGPVAFRIREAALRLHALTPSFWQHLSHRLPDPSRWPLALRDAYHRVDALRRAMQGVDTMAANEVLMLVPLLAPALAQGNGDAAIIQRELALAWLARSPHRRRRRHGRHGRHGRPVTVGAPAAGGPSPGGRCTAAAPGRTRRPHPAGVRHSAPSVAGAAGGRP